MHVQMDNPVKSRRSWLSKIKHKCYDRSRSKLEQWTDAVPFSFHKVLIDHKEPIITSSVGKKHCSVVASSFSDKFSVGNITAIETIKTLENFILPIGTPQKLVYNKGTAFINKYFTYWLHELRLTQALRTQA